MTEEEKKQLTDFYEEVSGESVNVVFEHERTIDKNLETKLLIGKTIVYGSELACLRLFAKLQQPLSVMEKGEEFKNLNYTVQMGCIEFDEKINSWCYKQRAVHTRKI